MGCVYIFYFIIFFGWEQKQFRCLLLLLLPYTRCPLHVSPEQSLNGSVLGQAYPGVVN